MNRHLKIRTCHTFANTLLFNIISSSEIFFRLLKYSLWQDRFICYKVRTEASYRNTGIFPANLLRRFNSFGLPEHRLCVLDTKEDTEEIRHYAWPQRIYSTVGVC